MYLFYLVVVIAASTGVGLFAHYNTAAKQDDYSDGSRIEVISFQQDVISRSLRRQFQIDPTAFPVVSAGEYAELDSDLVEASISVEGMINLGESSFYLSSDGDIMAVINDGTISPTSGNGDADLGVFGLTQNVEDFLKYLYGNDYTRSNLDDLEDDYDISLGDETGTDDEAIVDDENQSDDGENDPEEGETDYTTQAYVSGGNAVESAEVAYVKAPLVVTIGHLDMDALKYNETLEAALKSSNSATASGNTYEPDEFLQIQAQIHTE